MNDVVGKAKGGVARAGALTADERKTIAKKAADARWSGEIKTATHGSDDHPLRIGDIEIPCYVLEGGTRVLSQRGLQTGIGMSISGGSFGEQRMAGFVDSLSQKGINVKDLASRISNRGQTAGAQAGAARFRTRSGRGVTAMTSGTASLSPR